MALSPTPTRMSSDNYHQFLAPGSGVLRPPAGAPRISASGSIQAKSPSDSGYMFQSQLQRLPCSSGAKATPDSRSEVGGSPLGTCTASGGSRKSSRNLSNMSAFSEGVHSKNMSPLASREMTRSRVRSMNAGEFGTYLGDLSQLASAKVEPKESELQLSAQGKETLLSLHEDGWIGQHVDSFIARVHRVLQKSKLDVEDEVSPIMMTGDWMERPWVSLALVYRGGETTFRRSTKEQRTGQRSTIKQQVNFSDKAQCMVSEPLNSRAVSAASILGHNVRAMASVACGIEPASIKNAAIDCFLDPLPENAHALVLMIHEPPVCGSFSLQSRGTEQDIGVFCLCLDSDLANLHTSAQRNLGADSQLVRVAQAIQALLECSTLVKYMPNAKSIFAALHTHFRLYPEAVACLATDNSKLIADPVLAYWLLSPDLVSSTALDSNAEFFLQNLRSKALVGDVAEQLHQYLSNLDQNDEFQTCTSVQATDLSSRLHSLVQQIVCSETDLRGLASQLLEDLLVVPAVWFALEFGNRKAYWNVRNQGYSALPKSSLADHAYDNWIASDASNIPSSVSPPHSWTLQSNGLIRWYWEREFPFSLILTNMEKFGVGLDIDFLAKHRSTIVENVKHLETLAYQTVNVPFLITSPEQVAHVLYDVLKLERVQPQYTSAAAAAKMNSPQTTRKHHPTSESVLRQLADKHPLPNLILQYRSWFKTLTVYVDPFLISARLQAVGGLKTRESGHRTFILLPTWNHIGTATGRLSCSNPNLQSMPKTKGVNLNLVLKDDPLGRSPSRTVSGALEVKTAGDDEEPLLEIGCKRKHPYASDAVQCEVSCADTEPVPNDCLEEPSSNEEGRSSATAWIRDVIIPIGDEEDEMVFVSVDYKQFEMRMLAHLSQDSKMLEVFRRSDEGESDIYCLMASQCFHVGLNDVSPLQREKAKRLSLGLMYGMGRRSLAGQLQSSKGAEITPEEAEVRSSVNLRFPHKSTDFMHPLSCSQSLLTTLL